MQATPYKSKRRRRRSLHRAQMSLSVGWRIGLSVLVFMGLGLAVLVTWILTAPRQSTLLLMGIDSGSDQNSRGRSDVLVLLSVFHREGKVRALQIPRDLWVQLPDSTLNRLNAAYAIGGAKWTIQAIRENLGVKVDGYLVVEFAHVEKLVDALGGVRVELEKPTAGYEAGKHLMNGRRMLTLIRHRRLSGDIGRMRRMQEIVLPSLMREARADLAATLAWGVRYLFTADFSGVHPAAVLTLMSSPKFEGEAIAVPMVQAVKTQAGAEVLCGDVTAIVPRLRAAFGASFLGVQLMPRGVCSQNDAASHD